MNIEPEENVQIGGVAKTLGITTRTIRYYEEIGLMGLSERPIGSARTYAKKDIIRLKFVLKLKELGISLKEMQELAENYDLHQQDRSKIMPRLLDILDLHICKVDEKISKLSSLRNDILDYRCRVLEILK